MLIDYHTHHERCGHAVGKLEQYVRRGIELGLGQLGLSDHMPLIHVDPANYYPEMAMPMDELPRYVEEVLALKEKYKGQIELKLGLEGDYISGWEEQIERIVHAYPWDYVIGSVHFLGEWDVTDYRQTAGWEGRDPLEVYAEYYEAIGRAAETGFYDIIGHFDVIKRFGFAPPAEQGEQRSELEERALHRIARNGIVMELNASGLTKPCAEMFPSERLLRRAIELGIPLTLGSDAHDPAKLSENLDVARAQLLGLGVHEVATFDRRKRTMIALTE
ncbi:histidinol-phosphatase HisJ [Saccharibacillus sp. CPCC 101409]|uniref:histidinol-phosphatase HisJ n=1 Tax=Saccharibacillus sp. CPCC 101409 TaxID=3058041 RepID=UPI0026730580|nr:histidinol-phosphatase HisJ [Saccharibacillus sp. CPCC 101409]MDO3413118.1 histidinol-phosphatase HisJ [Saccharibacillus sp. CPCC 101409]